MMMRKYNWKVKSGLLSQLREEMQVDTFKGCGDINYRQQINMKSNTKRNQKSQLLKQNQLWQYFQLNLIKTDLTIQTLYPAFYHCLLTLKFYRKKK